MTISSIYTNSFHKWVDKSVAHHHLTQGNAKWLHIKFEEYFTQYQTPGKSKHDFMSWVNRAKQDGHFTDDNVRHILMNVNKVISNFLNSQQNVFTNIPTYTHPQNNFLPQPQKSNLAPQPLASIKSTTFSVEDSKQQKLNKIFVCIKRKYPNNENLPKLIAFLNGTYTFDHKKDYDLGFEDNFKVFYLDSTTNEEDRLFLDQIGKKYKSALEKVKNELPPDFLKKCRFANNDIYCLFDLSKKVPELLDLIKEIMKYCILRDFSVDEKGNLNISF